ncbi:MAG: carbohydrate ABC transporter permease [Thermomicrobiales bacterium]
MAVVTRELAPPQAVATVGESRTLDLVLKIVAYVALVLFALIMFVPFIFSVTTSLKTPAEANQLLSLKGLFWPDQISFDAYREVLRSDIDRWFLNSAIVAAAWVVGRAFTATTAGYAFARMQFPGRRILFLMILSTIIVPGIVKVVPQFILLKDLHMLDSYWALTLPFLTDAFPIFLMKQFFESFPRELEEAARVDGASRYRIFAQIALPNAMPAVTAVAIFSFQGSWNWFLEPVIFISSAHLRTMPLGLAYFYKAHYTDWPTLMAIAVLSTVPIAIFYLIFQRWFVEGQSRSGIKG